MATFEEESIADRFGPDVLADFMIDFMKRKEGRALPDPLSGSIGAHTLTSVSPEARRRMPCPMPSKRMDRNVFPRWSSIWTRTSAGFVNAVDELGLSNRDPRDLLRGQRHPWPGDFRLGGRTATKIRGGKMTMTDRGSRVPLIASWPGTIQPGTQCDDLVELADFLPTFLDMAAAPQPMQRVHGQSFLPQLLGADGPSREWVHIEYKENRQIRTKEWIYTDKGKLTQVNELGQPENRPEKQGNRAGVREEMERILGMIDGE